MFCNLCLFFSNCPCNRLLVSHALLLLWLLAAGPEESNSVELVLQHQNLTQGQWKCLTRKSEKSEKSEAATLASTSLRWSSSSCQQCRQEIASEGTVLPQRLLTTPQEEVVATLQLLVNWGKGTKKLWDLHQAEQARPSTSLCFLEYFQNYHGHFKHIPHCNMH